MERSICWPPALENALRFKTDREGFTELYLRIRKQHDSGYSISLMLNMGLYIKNLIKKETIASPFRTKQYLQVDKKY